MVRLSAVNFDELVKRVRARRCKQGDIAIWGGTCVVANLRSFMEQWNMPGTAMPYCIWEYISEIEFTSHSLFKIDRINWLQRGRMFGEDGDLEVRRQGDSFTWRFVGLAGTDPPEGYNAEAHNFWQHEPEALFHHYPDQRTLLWGEWSEQAGQWFDDRVARAKLTYPIEHTPPPQRVMLQYDTFSRNGVVEFVWFKRLVAWNGEQQ